MKLNNTIVKLISGVGTELVFLRFLQTAPDSIALGQILFDIIGRRRASQSGEG